MGEAIDGGMLWLSRSEFYVLNTTGPGLLSRTLAEAPSLSADAAVLFPDDVCEPSNWNRFGDFGIHLMDGSWRQEQSFVRRKLAQYVELLVFRKLRLESIELGTTRRMPVKTVGQQ